MVLFGKWGYLTSPRHTKVLGPDPVGKLKPKRGCYVTDPGKAQSQASAYLLCGALFDGTEFCVQVLCSLQLEILASHFPAVCLG